MKKRRFSSLRLLQQFTDPLSVLFTSTRGSSSGVKQRGREFGHSTPANAEVKNEWSYASTPPYVCMVRTGQSYLLALSIETRGCSRGCWWSGSVRSTCVAAGFSCKCKIVRSLTVPRPHANGALPFLSLASGASTVERTHKFNYAYWFRSSDIFEMAAGNYNETTWQRQTHSHTGKCNQSVYLRQFVLIKQAVSHSQWSAGRSYVFLFPHAHSNLTSWTIFLGNSRALTASRLPVVSVTVATAATLTHCSHCSNTHSL
jgi:hypothetical protein